MVTLYCKGMVLKVLDAIILEMIIEVENEASTKDLGKQIGAKLHGGEVFQLVGDVGAGKTTFVKGLAEGLGVDDEVQSPSLLLVAFMMGVTICSLFTTTFTALPTPVLWQTKWLKWSPIFRRLPSLSGQISLKEYCRQNIMPFLLQHLPKQVGRLNYQIH